MNESDTLLTRLEFLEKERQRIHEEIRGYPRPIPACDVQFNALLEERNAICAELASLKTALESQKRERLNTPGADTPGSPRR
jgi:hypothetical protein